MDENPFYKEIRLMTARTLVLYLWLKATEEHVSWQSCTMPTDMHSEYDRYLNAVIPDFSLSLASQPVLVIFRNEEVLRSHYFHSHNTSTIWSGV